MAPKPPEPKAAFLRRLAKAARQGETQIRWGDYHHSHAICNEGDAWRVRRLELDAATAEACLAEHGMFMPEHAEALSKPGEHVVLEAPTIDALIAKLDASWPPR